jgi:anti-repressor protein
MTREATMKIVETITPPDDAPTPVAVRELPSEAPVNRNAIEPIVTRLGDEIFASSLDVAAFFHKRHDHVLRDIDVLTSNPELGARSWFTEAPRIVATGDGGKRESRTVNMTRKGFTMLAFGFKGARARGFQSRYIDAFDKMEQEIRSRAVVGPDLSDPHVLRTLLLESSEREIKLQGTVDKMAIENAAIEQAKLNAEDLAARVAAENATIKPKATAFDHLCDADGALCITDAAKALSVRPKDLFDYLSRNGWTYKRIGSVEWLGYQSKIIEGTLIHRAASVVVADGSERIRTQVRVTAKGLGRLAILLSPPPRLI